MVALERVEWADPDLQRLVAEHKADVDARYGTDEVPAVEPETVRGAVLVRVEEEAVACGILIHPVPSFEDTTGELGRMFVASAHRRKGIAKEVLRELEAIAVELKFEQLVLETGIKQPEAIGLYSSEGYRIIDNYPPYEDSPDSRCFAKAL
ncbi:MAG TPA: GNAT family N-acetyltransferase [Candidatus Ruania gallistercoris]|uniref:GNAT family N-acetyltransferase n=1 Tax=Candidatus Ruania gallistercoris TaxID=2838746 RepID=A0A9D2J3B8_9MICO|nr:GNAT family N-acetyltransferase [Candidatus Ruania gallistercoris]